MALTVVTGANRGIGLELTRQLVARGDEVIAACRSASPELEATGAEIAEGIDVADESGVGILRSVDDRASAERRAGASRADDEADCVANLVVGIGHAQRPIGDDRKGAR